MTTVPNSQRQAFTLIELLVVISIIGLLATLLFANFANVRERGRDLRRKADLDQIRKALRLYYNDNQKYPASVNSATSNSISGADWGSAFASGTTTYMSILPQDPASTSTNVIQYNYYSGTGFANGSTETFCLIATLENAGDKDIATSQARCTVTCGKYGKTSFGTKEYAVCND